ncbi:MAG: hypothetical protein ACE5EV_00905 [Gaiellales bacterium]
MRVVGRRIARAAWRHRLFVAVMTAAFGLVGWYFASEPVEGPNTAVVVVEVASPGPRAIQTYARLAETGTVLQLAYAVAAPPVPPADQDVSITATAVDGTSLVELTVASSSGNRAEAVAGAVPQALAELAGEDAPADRVVAIEAVPGSTSRSAGAIALIVALAVLVGLVVNSLLAVALELATDRIREDEEVEERTGQRVITRVPFLAPGSIATSVPPPPDSGPAPDRSEPIEAAQDEDESLLVQSDAQGPS